MKNITLYILLLITFNSYSQRIITGIIKDREGIGLPGVQIIEVGTSNITNSDLNGLFQISILKDTCTLSFSFMTFETKTVKIINDTSINVTLEEYHYESRWMTIGSNYEVINSTFGFILSNGMDENPLIHFEDFDDDWMFKISGSTDFKKDYSFETKITYDYFRYIFPNRPSIEYIHRDYSSENFSFSDLNLSCGIWIRFIQSNLFVKFGYQNLNENKNFGAEVGMQKSYLKLYYGFMIGYWFDYYTYKVYLQGFIYKKKISLRAYYDRIEKYDFLNVGINYTFKR